MNHFAIFSILMAASCFEAQVSAMEAPAPDRRRAREEPEYSVVHVNNVSDSTVYGLFEALNEDGSLNTDYPANRFELRMGQDSYVAVLKSMQWRVAISAEKDDVKKLANSNLVRDTAINSLRAVIMGVSGYNNYDLRGELSLNHNNHLGIVQRLRFDDSGSYVASGIPRYRNPYNGYLDVAEAAGFALQASAAALTLARTNMVTTIINPATCGDGTDYQGIRLQIGANSSKIITGIELHQTLVPRGLARGFFHMEGAGF